MNTYPGALPLPAFLTHPWQPPEPILTPWLHQGGIAELYGERGGGKTNVSLALALVVASGTSLFSGMFAPQPRRVLYVDGEMHPVEVQKRFRMFIEGMRISPATQQNLLYLSHAALPNGIPTLYSTDSGGRQIIERAAGEHRADLIILDNISALVRGGEENSNDAWEPMNEWLLGLRRANYTSLLIHHAGKRQLDGTIRQRGSSKKEDPMSAVIQIDKTSKPKGGKVPLKWTYEKCRSFTPDEHDFQFSVCFDDAGGKAWLEEGSPRALANLSPPPWLPRAQELMSQHKSFGEIAKTCDVPKTTLYRWLTGRAFTVGDLAS